MLVGDNNLVKISDFGLSRILGKDDSYYKLSQHWNHCCTKNSLHIVMVCMLGAGPEVQVESVF